MVFYFFHYTLTLKAMYTFDKPHPGSIPEWKLYNKDNRIITKAVCGFVLIVNYAQVEK